MLDRVTSGMERQHGRLQDSLLSAQDRASLRGRLEVSQRALLVSASLSTVRYTENVNLEIYILLYNILLYNNFVVQNTTKCKCLYRIFPTRFRTHKRQRPQVAHGGGAGTAGIADATLQQNQRVANSPASAVMSGGGECLPSMCEMRVRHCIWRPSVPWVGNRSQGPFELQCLDWRPSQAVHPKL